MFSTLSCVLTKASLGGGGKVKDPVNFRGKGVVRLI